MKLWSKYFDLNGKKDKKLVGEKEVTKYRKSIHDNNTL